MAWNISCWTLHIIHSINGKLFLYDEVDCFSIFFLPGFSELQVLVVHNYVSLGALLIFVDEILHFD